MLNFLKKIREQFNIFLFDNKKRVIYFFRILTILACFSAVGLIVWLYGFEHSAMEHAFILDIIRAHLFLFLLNFLVRAFFSLKLLNFLRSNKLEAFLILLLLYEIASIYIYQKPLLKPVFDLLNIQVFDGFHVLFTQIYVVIFVGLQLVKYLRNALQLSIKPSLLFVLSFLAVIFVGSGLLMLPEMTTSDQPIPYIDALFTSVSATCITGLIVVDTATYFSFKGQMVILMLMQFGGIGIISFASFFAFFLKKGLSIRHQTVLQDFLSEDSLDSSKKLIRQIIFFTFFIEAVGVALIYVLWQQEMEFIDVGEKIFFSVFHAVSAFCNAGFALFTEGLMAPNVADNYMLHIAMAGLIILGGLGFPALRDLFSIENLRERINKPWKRWKLSTTVAVYTTVLLLVGGTIAFFLLENNLSLKGLTVFESLVTSFFQSVTTRTAGFNTVDIGALAVPTIIVFIFLMFIGASPGGTGGGIKTSTFFLILLSVKSTITNKNQLQFKRRNISYTLLNKAFTIFIFSSTFILICVFILSLSEPEKDILRITFETVSAFATVGLSMGITADLTVVGKTVIIVAMFMGRVGLLTFAFALSKDVKSNNYRYPNTNMMIG